ncbi:MAG: NUDIX hydrolase [Muribaculaceae bacterium]|nr:NUDIX hydrolase [Muribaculaceae bacterium]
MKHTEISDKPEGLSQVKDDKAWKTLSSEYIFNRHPWMTVRKDTVELPDGRINDEFYVLEYPDWVNVIAITDHGEFVMERQYRHGLGQTGYEICAGVMEEGETPLEAAKRELLEETGFEGGEWTPFMVISGNPSVTNNLTHCFLATGVHQSGSRHLDATEDIDVVLLKEEEVLALLTSDNMKQALMAAPLWKYFWEKRN